MRNHISNPVQFKMKLILILVVVLYFVQSSYCAPNAPEEKCENKNEEWGCQIPCSEHNCDVNIPYCDPTLVKRRCELGCYCVDGYWRNGKNGKCIKKKKCPKTPTYGYVIA